ncbi:peroxiredoxin [Adhaeretor mobilis]|uniref:thioredoxin-dependent peroxiredoxin n=1 Tax=Adhaeretor mobilis TaxID=1930276 RepID=A0A517MRZ2_9BACT|nr:peroxiredoxin [Adhaeretor mobilis]QDS97652.1 Putative peroxiredoxin bcp [Adhaeretor mobilis]
MKATQTVLAALVACSLFPLSQSLLAAAEATAERPAARPTAEKTASVSEEKEKKKPVDLKVGDKAPKFSGQTDRGKNWKSEEHIGKKILVVYFYPADMTSGCTKQACSYRDAVKALGEDESALPRRALPIEVIGVSGDSVENHKHFRQEHKLNFTLLADPKGEIAKVFGVKTGKGGKVNWQLDGHPIELVRGVTTSRWTFVIGPNGKIVYKNDKVDPRKDAGLVMKAIESLKTEE